MEWPPAARKPVKDDLERDKHRRNRYRRIRNKAREHHLSGSAKPPLPLHLIASHTPALTNGDRGENSDGGSSMKDGATGYRSRHNSTSRSRDGSRERSPALSLEPDYGVIQTQPRPRDVKKPIPRRHTVGGKIKSSEEEETERSKEAFMDMLATRYPQYAEKISSTASEDGFPVRGRSRDPRRRATVVSYNPTNNRSLEYDDIGTMSEVDAPTFHRGGYVRSSLPAARTPTTIEQPSSLVFLIFRDETKKALLPNEITHLDTVRAMFVRSFPGKLTMSFLESPKRKIYILELRTNIYYQLEELRDIKDRTVLRIHETDSVEPQKVAEHPEVRGRTLQIQASAIPVFNGSIPSSAITSQVHKTHQPSMHSPLYVSHEEISQSPSRSSYGADRSRSLTPDPARMSGAYTQQNPIYGRMGISPERPPPPQERLMTPIERPPGLRVIPENRQMQNGHMNTMYQNYPDSGSDRYHQQVPGAPSPLPTQGQGHGQGHSRPPHRQAMSPPAVPTAPRVADPGRRAFSPPASLKHYDYIQVVSSGSQVTPGAPTSTYVAKGVRASTVLTPQRASGAPSLVSSSIQPSPTPGQTTNWRERSPVGRHTLAFTTAPYSGMAYNTTQRSQSYRVTPTTDRDSVFLPPRSMTPQPVEPDTRDRIDKMELQLANLAAWVQTAVVQTGSTGAPSSGKPSTSNSLTSDSPSPVVETASGYAEEQEQTDDRVVEAGVIQAVDVDGAIVLSPDMRTKILAIKKQAEDLRLDLRSLRRLHQINKESIIETVDEAWKKIKRALASVPGAERLLVRQQRQEVDQFYRTYLDDKARADKELGDLEAAVEELRSDVLARQCRVNMSDVEGMALVLSHVTKALGDLKVRFQQLMDQLKMVMSAEMEVIVMEEKFLKEEPEKLDMSLKKCKKLTGTLFTLKRLASVQEHRPPQVPALNTQAKIPSHEDKKALLENIQAMIPNHDARLQSLQAAETSRQRKKKITTQQEALRFGKSLELASKALKPPGTTATTTTAAGETTQSGAKSSTTYTTSSVTAAASNMSDTASVLSFANPMSTSTPKSSGTPPTHKGHSGSASILSSLSLTQPTVSLIRAVTPRKCLIKKDNTQSSTLTSRDTSQQPAVISVTSSTRSHPGIHQTAKSKATAAVAMSESDTAALNNQKLAARAAFFSSLASPITPTTTSEQMSVISGPSAQSPTEGPAKMAAPFQGSPGRTIPSLVRSAAVTTMPSSTSTSSYSHSSASAHKPSTLQVTMATSSSVVSSQKFSPASPNSTSGAKPRTVFSAIPKPYSPTRPAASPLTPESPKYRIPPSQLGRGVSRDSSAAVTAVTTSSKDSATKHRKVPPPPPPRKSSRLPGHAVLAVNAATTNGKLTSSIRETQINGSEGGEEVGGGKRVGGVESKLSTDVIDPPVAFATPELQSSKTRPSVITSKKISRSNLNSGQKVLKFEKDIELGSDREEEETVTEPIYDTVEPESEEKVSNLDDGSQKRLSREGSVESTSSSSSLDSQREVVWLKRPEVPALSSETTLVAMTTTDSTKTTSDSSEGVSKTSTASMPTNVEVSVATSSKVSQGVPQMATRADSFSSTSSSSSSCSSSTAKDISTSTSASGATETQAVDVKVSGKKVKPAPPQRRSSLSSKSQTDTE